uniref:Putative microtubule associated-protein orbit n=1 Tax=Corethrella appendiculata TaxID=1370023 RepID=W4VRQ5_9DIPT
MAYQKPSDLDGFITQMMKSDMRIKAQLAEDLVLYLSDSENSIECSDLGLLIDGLIPWMTGSHFKIAQRALEAFTEIIGRLGHDFVAYTSTILPHVVDRLGDSRDTVREKAQLLLHKLMESRVLQPQTLLDKLTVCFKHKNAKVREEFLQTIVNALNEYGTQSLSVKNFIQPIVILLGDPTPTVRDAAIQTLVEIYKHVGDKLRIDLRKKEVPAGKMIVLEQKFDEVRSDGLLLPSAYNTVTTNDEADTAAMPRPTRLVKRTPSATPRKPTTFDSGDLAAGAVSAEIFEASFENVPQLTIYAQRDMDDHMKTINTLIGDKNVDWEKRVDALKKIRSLLMLNVQSSPTFVQQLKDLSIAFLDILKELRSQVIREACITLAYMAKTLKNKLDQFSIYILQELINLIQNSAKVISSSGTIALKYVLKYVHAPKILPILTQNLMQSKSKDIRSTLCETFVILLEDWPTKALERNSIMLKDALRKGIQDADSEARRHSRRAYWCFRQHFPDLADNLYGTLDPATQRTFEKERDNLGTNAGFRSISAVDTAAAQRARARAQYSNLARLKVTSGTASLQGQYAQQARAKKAPMSLQQQQQQQQASPERQIRSRSGVSQSQPTSRSTSPSNRLRENFSTYSAYRQTGTVPKKSSGIPRSLANSRETSPTRTSTQFGSLRRNMYSTNSPRRPDRPPVNPGRPVLAQKILQQSREAENALADALSPDDPDISSDFSRLSLNRKMSREDDDDGSEASSVCSERSFDSFRRGNDSYSWNGSRNRLDSTQNIIEDIDTIIHYCASAHWSERKDGLSNLTRYLSEGKILTQQQLQCVLDLFRKMFMDPHIKVYALFLDTVNELILSQSNDLHDWLFILLTRLFNKLGTDLLGSMHGKIWKTLQLIYEYFPADLQMQCVFKILVDAAQTPNTKTRYATLNFLTTLTTTYCTAREFQIQQQQLCDRSLQKIIQISLDQKSIELKNQAKACIVALYNCNTSHMTLSLSNLPKEYQDIAKQIIQHHMRRNTSGTNSPSSPLSSSSPKPLLSPQQGPYSLQNNSSPRSRQTSVETHESMNTEEIYKNLRKTTAEIQNYSFESKLDRDTNSKDSGISQMGDHVSHTDPYSLPTNGLNGHLGIYNSFEKDDSCNGSKTQSATTTESNTPENTVRLDSIDINHKMSSQQRLQNYTFADNGEILLEKGIRESEIVKAAILLSHDTPPEQIEQVLTNLQVCIKYGNCQLPIKNFKAIMKMLLSLMESPTTSVVIVTLHTLGKVVRSGEMKTCWSNFLELILLKIIDCYKISKEVSREIDVIINKIAAILPLDVSINILNPVIATADFPANLCALKILTDLTDKQGKNITDNQLDNIMPNVARLAEDTQSMVRKAAVFCIVKLYIVMGEEKVKPKFSLLNSSKIRLLNVYIAKTQSGGSNKSSSS